MNNTVLSLLALLSISLLLGGCVASEAQSVQPGNQTDNQTSGQAANQANASSAAQPDQAKSGMKVIGMIGGVSWLSSAEYYTLINERVNQKLGGSHSAKILMYSIDFGEVSDDVKAADKGNWTHVREIIMDAAQRLKAGGADFIIIPSNTMNYFADDLQQNQSIYVLNIADATARKVNESGKKRVALLASKFVMEQDFYRKKLTDTYGITMVKPNETEQDYINSVIFDELTVGRFRNESRDGIIRIINRMVNDDGIDGVVLGCTELPMLIKQDDVSVQVYDTTAIHADAAADYALGK